MGMPFQQACRSNHQPFHAIFLRRKHSPSGQCLQMVESYRNVQGDPCQRVVVSLGNLAIPQSEQVAVAKAVEQKLCGQVDLLPSDLSPQASHWVDAIVKRIECQNNRLTVTKDTPTASTTQTLEAAQGAKPHTIDGVILEKVDHTHTTPLGPSLVGLDFWNRLGMPSLLADLGFNHAQAQAAAISVINRLASPGSERALLDWLPDSSLPELMDIHVTAGIKDRFYRISDRLHKHQAAIEKHLRQKQQELFQSDRTVLLYDLTNSYFEGEALGNPKAKRGKSKEKRNDCPQIVVGMIFDRSGCELVHKVFEGNQSDSKSLPAMVQELQEMLPDDLWSQAVKPLVIVDAGVATLKNLRLLRKNHFHYLVNDSRRGRSKYRKEFAQEDQFTLVGQREEEPPVKVRLLVDPYPPESEEEDKPGTDKSAADKTDPPDHLVLCCSQGRRQKEEAIRSRIEIKFVDLLSKLAVRVESGQIKDADKIHRSIGRLQQRHSRVQRFYTVQLKADETAPSKQRLEWKRLDEAYKSDDALLGCYVLRLDQAGGSPQEWWRLYTTLSKAEEGFRSLKSDLGLRPNYHQKEIRVEGHVLITVLAYHLMWSILQTLQASGDHRSWETIRRILQTHAYTTILLPTQEGKLYRVRRAGQPEECQKAIYKILKVDWSSLPQFTTVVDNSATTL